MLSNSLTVLIHASGVCRSAAALESLFVAKAETLLIMMSA